MSADRALSLQMGILASVAVVFTLYVSDAILAPVACGLFLISLVWPIQRRLQMLLPPVVALAIVAFLTVTAFLLFASVMTWGFGRIGRSLISDAAQFQSFYEQVATWLEARGVAIAGLWADHFDARWLLRNVQGVSARINTMVSFWLIVFLYAILGLLEIRPLTQRIRDVVTPANAELLIQGGELAAVRIRRYMFIRTVMSVTTGLAVWALASLFGLRLAAEWGIVAFTLNYIPFIGPWIATVLPACYALAQFQSPQTAVTVFLCLSAVQFVIGSYIEPRVAGTALGISPSVVLFSVFLWAFLWGIFGAFIGVPITIAVLTFCAQFPSTRWIGHVLGDGS